MITKPIKYTAEFVSTTLDSMIKEIETDTSIVFINQLLSPRKISKQRWSEIALKFKDNDQITELIQQIETELESRIVLGGLDTSFNPAMAIFALKNKYGWVDTRVNANVNLPTPILNGVSKDVPSDDSHIQIGPTSETN